MLLVRMVYVSTTVEGTGPDELQSILKTARANNPAHDLTGLMVFNRKYYLQVIEGGRMAVSRLLGNLYKDPRHKDLVVLEFDYIAQRRFADWSMQFVPAESLTKEMILRSSASSDFDPYALSKDSALSLLCDLREAAGKTG